MSQAIEIKAELADLIKVVSDYDNNQAEWPDVRMTLFSFCELIDQTPGCRDSKVITDFRDSVQRYADGDLKMPWLAIKPMLPKVWDEVLRLWALEIEAANPSYEVEIVRGNVRVSLDWIGEGTQGDFDEEDPADSPLMRFGVDRLEEGEWVAVDDASYCTQIHRDASPEDKLRIVETIMGMVADKVESGISIKKLCEELSWLSAPAASTPSTTSNEGSGGPARMRA